MIMNIPICIPYWYVGKNCMLNMIEEKHEKFINMEMDKHGQVV